MRWPFGDVKESGTRPQQENADQPAAWSVFVTKCKFLL
jgi:hypothetical protein